MGSVRLDGGVSPVASVDANQGVIDRPADASPENTFVRTSKPSNVRRPTATKITAILFSALTVGVLAVTLGCQPKQTNGAPLATQNSGVIATSTTQVRSPSGDFEALPAEDARSTDVVSPHGDFEALPPQAPE